MVPGSAPLHDSSTDGAAFGEFLRRAREQRGLTLQQISSETKIPWRHLEALEHGRLNAVPGGTYRRGEIRAYAEAVGLDKTIALERLDRALEATTPPPSTKPHAKPRVIPLRNIATAAAALGLLFALFWGARDGTATPTQTAPAAAASASAPTAATPGASTPGSSAAASAPAAEGTSVAPSATAATTAAEPGAPAAMPALTQEEKPLLADAGLTVTSEPPGARVTVDGIAWGSTPLTIAHLALGEHRVRVTKAEFGAAERTVRLTGERPTNALHVYLQRLAPQQ
jgi:cytoskeletal protein RodZ